MDGGHETKISQKLKSLQYIIFGWILDYLGTVWLFGAIGSLTYGLDFIFGAARWRVEGAGF